MPGESWPQSLGAKSRCDLAVVHGLSHAQATQMTSLIGHLSAVIEVKRAFAPKAQIDQDLQRLATFKSENPTVRAFLFVVAEAMRPKAFVAPEGKAILGKTPIKGAKAHYRVRRACKAAAAFSGKETAHYACIIEVYNGL